MGEMLASGKPLELTALHENILERLKQVEDLEILKHDRDRRYSITNGLKFPRQQTQEVSSAFDELVRSGHILAIPLTRQTEQYGKSREGVKEYVGTRYRLK